MWWGERLFRVTIVDDAGVRHPVGYGVESPYGDPVARKDWQRFLLTKHRGVVVMWVCSLLTIAVALMVRFSRAPEFVFWGLMVAATGLSVPMAWHSHRLGRKSFRESRLRRHMCPACAYGIAGVPPRPDGLTVCPECAAAWRLSP